MNPYADRPNTIHWPPILYGLAFLLPWLLDWLIPLPAITLGHIAEDVMIAIGWALIATGITVGYLALRSFAGAGTPFDPTARAEKLVTFGLYNRTRNPMYLAAMVAFFGLALSTGDVWRFAVLVPLFLGLQRLAILREEAHLEARFGESWRDYAEKVSRWW
jgi:protein-S-isoprenylcysteine O-methyltransferase Ste14